MYLIKGICSYTDQELEAHSRVLNNLSVDSGVNILDYLQKNITQKRNKFAKKYHNRPLLPS